MNKTGWIAAGTVLFLGAAGGMFYAYESNKQQPVTGGKEIQVEVIHKDGSKKTWTIQTDQEYLGPVLLAEDLISGSEGPYGLYVEEVDGEEAVYDKDQAYWRLQVAGEDSQSGADATPIEDQKTYTWIYTTANE